MKTKSIKAINSFISKIKTKERQSIKQPSYGKGIAESRAYGMTTITEMKKSAAKNTTRLKRKARFNLLVMCLYQRLSGISKYAQSCDSISRHGRSIGNDIHDFPHNWTGMITTRAVETGDHCVEHFYARKNAGDILVKMSLEDDFNVRTLTDYINIVTQTHITTTKENLRLRSFQNNKSINFLEWKKMYDQACSPLIIKDSNKPWISMETRFPSIHKYL